MLGLLFQLQFRGENSNAINFFPLVALLSCSLQGKIVRDGRFKSIQSQKSKHSCVFDRVLHVRLNMCLHYYRQQFPFTLHIVSTKSLLFYCVFRTEIIICYNFQQQYAQEMHQWQSFLHCGQCPVVLVRCLLVAVTKFQDKFASLRQENSSNSQDKFQKCCTDMYLVEF